MGKKVLIISHEFPPVVGGAGIIAEDLVKKFIDNDSEVTVVTNYMGRNFKDKYNLLEVKTIPKIRFINYWKCIKSLPIHEYDIIILNDIGACMVGAYFFDEDTLKKTVVFLHGSEPESIFINPSIWFKTINFKYKYKKLLEKCKTIIAVSNYMKNKFIEYTKWNLLNNKIKVVYNGVDDTVFYQDPINIKKELQIDKKAKLLLSVGRIVENKGYLEMYDVFKKIREKHNYHWIIIGEGNFRKNFDKVITSEGFDKYIHFIGKVDRSVLRKYYSSVDYFWLLSNYNEALGLVYIEAQFCFTPAIGRNNAGVKEVIINNKTGYLINDPIEVIKILNKGEELKSENFNEIINKFLFSNNTKILMKDI